MIGTSRPARKGMSEVLETAWGGDADMFETVGTFVTGHE